MKTEQPLPVISSRAFWSDKKQFDPLQDADYIIARVFDCGTHADMLECIRFYGIETIKKALIQAPDLQTGTISLTALWLGLDPKQYYSTNRNAINPITYLKF